MAQDIAVWLEGLGLGHHVQAFRDNSIDLELVPELAEDDLKELGLNIGERRTLQRALRGLGSGDAPAPAPEDRSLEVASAETTDVERRQLTVMFCDLVGSTALSARLDPEDLRGVMLEYQEATASVIERYDGFIAKYLGDGVLVYFGYPVAHEDNAERAVRAGFDILESVAKLTPHQDVSLRTRIGIATGLVVD